MISLDENSKTDKFILDVHLGKLAKNLRLLGFDCSYTNSFSKDEMIELAVKEHRILVTKDASLLKNKSVAKVYQVESSNAKEQLISVVKHFNLKPEIKPFTRCLVCNGILVEAGKKDVEKDLQEKTRLYYHDFLQCANCNQIYWKGSHYERMQQFIEEIKQI